MIMAQSAIDFSPPVRIGTCASDNKMTSLDVKRRHTYIKKFGEEKGLEVVANGSDGDIREMKFMLEHSGIVMTMSDYNKNSEEYRFLKMCIVLLSCEIKMSDFDS